ncbi:Pol protein [Pelomyxa schiedti]|nr:Pol protein [Pelomyxa schiedti]
MPLQTGTLTSDSKRKDEITRNFWAPLLGPISSDPEARQELLSKYTRKLTPIPDLTLDDLEGAIMSSKSKSAPGPDGIGFAAWKAFPTLSAAILYEMFEWLSEHEAPAHFNDSLFFAFPKVEGTTLITESRPISPPNADNRIITKAIAHTLNPLIADLCHPNQNGFFEGRLIDNNITSISNLFYGARSKRMPIQFLFTDFSKAYDNLDRDAIIQILQHIEMTPKWVNVIQHLMQTTEAYLPSGIHFPLRRGVRQGCPLSPILFNIVIDTLLRMLQRSPMSPKISAYADDICTLWGNAEDLDKASPLFNCYCKSTGAALNMKKTEILAGYPPVPHPVTSKAWPVQTVTSYKYLGVLIGHLSSTERISPSITKAIKRAQEIIPRVIGLQRKILATNLYVNSILTYQCRFEIYPLKTVWNPYMGKIYRLITPSHCTSQEHLTTLTADGGFATPLLDMAWWNVATAVSALRHPNRTDPKKVLPTSPLQLIHTFNEKIPPTLRSPTDIYRAILDERPGKSLHHKLRTTMIEKPTAAH